jgi:hypothetical protein
VSLIPLICFKCETPVPAQPDEVAWVCTRCGQGLLLDEEKGLAPLDVQYSAALPPGATGRPFWVAQGTAVTTRKTYGSRNESHDAALLWSTPRRFFIPAFNCPLEAITTVGPRLLTNPPALEPGPAAPFQPITLHPADIQGVAEYIVLSIEAGRKDNLKEIQIQLKLSEPTLWVLP